MVNRIPANAYDEYLAMGADRSYRALADRYGVSKVAVYKRAKKDGWQQRIAELEAKAREQEEEKAVDEIQAIRDQQLKEARYLRSRALTAMASLPPEKAIRAATALNIAWKHELLLLGEATERHASVEELIRQETRDLLTVMDDEDGEERRGA